VHGVGLLAYALLPGKMVCGVAHKLIGNIILINEDFVINNTFTHPSTLPFFPRDHGREVPTHRPVIRPVASGV